MKIIKGLLFFFFISLAGSVDAQDIHFTQFYLSPLTTNPAYSGAFQGTFRVGGIYRDQWGIGNLVTNSYRTPSFYIDAPVLMVGKRNWIGVGAMFLSDKAGSLNLATTRALGSVALHMPLDKKAKNVLTFGVQGGYVNRKIDLTNAIFADQIGNGTQETIDNNLLGKDGDFKTDYIDLHAGILLKSQLNEKMKLEMGLSLRNILTPDYHLNKGGTVGNKGYPDTSILIKSPNQEGWDLPGDFLFHGQFFVDMNDKWVIKPAFLFQTLSGANEIMIQALAGYHLNEKKDMTLNFGIGYRLRDATKFIVGMDYKKVKVGISYDLTVSELKQAANTGGFELGVSYTARIFKKPVVKPVIFCPRF